MNHYRARRRLTALLEAELPSDEAIRVRSHAAGCPHCSLALRQHRLTEVLLRRVPPSLLPEQASLAARRRLRAVAGAAPAPRMDPADGLALRALAAAAVMAALLLVLSVGPLSPRRAPPSSWSGILPSAERDSTLLASTYEPAQGWVRD